MKKYYLSFLACAITCSFSCNKELVQEKALSKAVPEFNVVYGEAKVQMLALLEKDPIFINYIKSVIAIEKEHRAMIDKNPNFNFEKGKTLSNPKSEAELISTMKTTGYTDPESLIAKTKESKVKLLEVYKKYPDFTKSLTSEEKKAFFTKVIKKITAEK